MNVLRVGAVEFGDLWVWDFDLNFSLPAFALVFDLHFHSVALCIFSALCTLYSVLRLLKVVRPLFARSSVSYSVYSIGPSGPLV